MQLTPAALAPHLNKGLRTLYTLHGDEPLLQLQAQDSIRQAARAQGFVQRSVFVVNTAHFDWREPLHAGLSMGLFGDKQLIELRIPGGKPGKEGSEALQKVASTLDPNTLWLVSLPRLDKATQNSGWFQALAQNGVSVKIDTVERHALPEWIAKQLHAQGQRVRDDDEGAATLQFFADCVEGHLLAAHQEIQKLALLYPAGELERTQIESAIVNVARYDVFKLPEALLAGRAARTQHMIDGLCAEGHAAVLVHWAIAQEIQTLKKLVDATTTGGKSIGAALRELRVWGPREKYLERLAKSVSPASANRLLQAAHVVDGIVKGIAHPEWPSDPWQALHRLAQQVVRLSGV